jgi:hypothetical protein
MFVQGVNIGQKAGPRLLIYLYTKKWVFAVASPLSKGPEHQNSKPIECGGAAVNTVIPL